MLLALLVPSDDYLSVLSFTAYLVDAMLLRVARAPWGRSLIS